MFITIKTHDIRASTTALGRRSGRDPVLTKLTLRTRKRSGRIHSNERLNKPTCLPEVILRVILLAFHIVPAERPCAIIYTWLLAWSSMTVRTFNVSSLPNKRARWCLSQERALEFGTYDEQSPYLWVMLNVNSWPLGKNPKVTFGLVQGALYGGESMAK